MLAGFKNFDPEVEKKLACHPDLPTFACKHGYTGRSSPQREATGDLMLVAFYYLLRVGEYTTKSRRKRKRTRTRQFRLKDIVFFRNDASGRPRPLPHDATDEEIMSADAATLRISNQKNGHKGACVHHSAIAGDPFACPVRALGRRAIHIRQHTKSRSTLLCAFWDDLGRADVTNDMVSFEVKMAAKALDYPGRGMPLARMDTHSLRSGGACALKLAGRDDIEIQKMGRWAPKSTAFLEYIQQQLSTFSAGMATDMSRIEVFHNMEGVAGRNNRRHLTVH